MSTLIKRNLSLFMLIMLMINVINVFAQRPEYVYDEFDILTDAEEKEIDDFLYEVDVQLDGAEIVFVIEGFLEPYPTIFDMALDYFENVELSGKTGIGKAGKDNGVLVIMTLKTGDYYLMTGYGVEGDITDAEAGRILDNLIEHLDDWDDFNGIQDCAEEIAEQLGYKEPVPEPVVIDEPVPIDNEPITIPNNVKFNAFLVALAITVLILVPVSSRTDDEKYIWEARF